MNDFELHTFVKGWLKNIRFNKYCFPSLTDRKANKKKTTIKIPLELSAKIVLDNNIISASIFVVITLIGACQFAGKFTKLFRNIDASYLHLRTIRLSVNSVSTGFPTFRVCHTCFIGLGYINLILR